MQIRLVENSPATRPLYAFFAQASDTLRERIHTKFEGYSQHGDVYSCKGLKILNARIWKYHGTIYKLRVDNGKESARVLFVKTTNGDLLILHAFLKSTRKTPSKEAKQAIRLFHQVGDLTTVIWGYDLVLK